MVIIIGILCLLIVWIWDNNHHIVVTKYRHENLKCKEGGRVYRIVQLSDIHGDLPFGKSRKIYEEVSRNDPDIVVVTGDSIDKIHLRHKEKVLKLFAKIQEKYPLYVVTGNHEYMQADCEDFLHQMEQEGIRVFHDEWVDVQCGACALRLIGLDDPYALYRGNVPDKYCTPRHAFECHVRELFRDIPPIGCGVVLCSHRPEYLGLYAEIGSDIVLAGHAHGGQWRLPLLGALISPDQGFHPAYTEGRYDNGRTAMYVSRGLGNSVVPFRLFNRPEIVVLDIAT